MSPDPELSILSIFYNVVVSSSFRLDVPMKTSKGHSLATHTLIHTPVHVKTLPPIILDYHSRTYRSPSVLCQDLFPNTLNRTGTRFLQIFS